jgi:ADP-ribose pyrophosphatase
MDFTEKTLNQTTVFTGKIINVRVDQVQLCNGSVHTREVAEHNGGVCIVAVDSDENVLMVTQYRYPIGQHLLEIPAGKLEKGEQPLAAAARELSEETGYTAAKIVPMGEFYPTPGFCSEKLYLYLATDLTPGQCHPDEDEFLTVSKIKLDTLVQMVMDNEIIDGKTIAAVLKARKYLA